MATINVDNASYQTYGELPAIGSAAPDVSLVGTDLQNVSFARWMGIRKVLNIFVSVDTEPGARSVLEFDRLAGSVEDVVMLMVSYDLPFAHKRFGDLHELQHTFGLSAVRHAGFGQNYGVLIKDGPYAGMFAPAVVVLDENNTVVHAEMLENMTAEPDYRTALRALGIEIDE